MSTDASSLESLATSVETEQRTPASLQRTLWIMSAACGASAANIYYNQPLLGKFASYFHVSSAHAGLAATASQIGYGTGIFFFVPLGDLFERRKIILGLASACVVLCLVSAVAPVFSLLLLCQLLVGMAAVGSQLLIPLSIDLSPPKRRGRTVGQLMLGLLCGILLARTLAGFVGDWLGWRAMYFVAAGIMLVMVLVLQATLPHRKPTMMMPYRALMRSMLGLLQSQPKIWTASVVSGLSFGAFNTFWTTLVFLMQDRFHRGAAEAGMFGIVGIVGALGAPLAGKFADRRGPNVTVSLALLSTLIAFALMWTWVAIVSLVIGVLLMDLGVQSIQVAEQAKLMALVPEARNRVNTLYMVARFVGGASGSALGAVAWSNARWPGVCATASGLLALAMVIHVIGTKMEGRL